MRTEPNQLLHTDGVTAAGEERCSLVQQAGDFIMGSIAINECPKCNAEMEQGFVGTEQKGGGILGGLKCSKVLWCKEFKMGFFGSPKGEDISGQNTHKKYMAIPAARCTVCRVVVFEY